jgi:predicted amidohydrolase YtcJ
MRNFLTTCRLFMLPLLAAAGPALAASETADTIFSGGPIVTMIRDGDRVEAVAVRDGVIMATGREESIMTLRGPDTTLVDLEGRCLMPGFIDPHSHIVMQSAKFACVNLDPYPIGDIKTIADIQRKLRERIVEKQRPPGAVVIGWGYDDTSLAEGRHPDRDDLDAVSTEHPILLIHISSHLVAANSLALEMAGINAETEDPPGGHFQRKAGSREPNGVIEERGIEPMLKLLPQMAPEDAIALVNEGLKRYAAEGITTAGEGAAFPDVIKLLQSMAESDAMPIDVIAYPHYAGVDEPMAAEIARTWKTPGRFRFGGVKIVMDGSIQGYTAYLSEPYYRKPGTAATGECPCDSPVGMRMLLGNDAAADTTEAEHEHVATTTDRGYPGISQEQIDAWIEKADGLGFPLHVHCNGDAAIDSLIESVAKKRGDWPRPDLRTTIIHAQTIRDDQLDFAATHGLLPSFFPIHVVFWGDRHRDLFLGPERAARINPARSALDRGMKITLHHDAPIAHWGMLPVAAAAVNRVTSGGQLLGPDERITPYEALRAVTKDAAWQYFEEHRKGTIERGKLADLVILDADPLAIDPAQLAGIKVLETIKEGQTIYRAE